MHDIAVLYEVVLALGGQLAGSTALRFAAQRDEIVVFDDLGTNEAPFEIRMDDSGTLRCFSSGTESPGTHFVASGCEECAEIEQSVELQILGVVKI